MKYHPLLEQQLNRFIQIRNNENDRFLRQISIAYEEFENTTSQICHLERLASISTQLLQLQIALDEDSQLDASNQLICKRGADILQASRLGLWHIDREQLTLECECEYIVKANAFITEKSEIINHIDDFDRSLLSQRYLWLPAEAHSDTLTLEIPITIDQFLLGVLRASFDHLPSSNQALSALVGSTLGDFIRYAYLKYRRQLALDELEESEHRFKSLAESTGAAIFAFRETVIYANKATEDLIGLDQAALKLLPVSIILGIDFAKRFNSHTLSNKRSSVGIEIEFARPSGEIRWAFINIAQTHFAGQHTWLASAFDITERKRAEIQMRYQAYHDNLTSLPNRLHACRTLDNCLTKSSRDRYYRFAAAIIEIHDLSELAEQLGYSSVDHYLIEIALRLKTFSQTTDHTAKVAHNSFLFVRENIPNKENMLEECQTLFDIIKQPLKIDGLLVSQPISMGITYCDQLYRSGEEILRNCSIAARSRKSKIDKEITLFNEVMLQQIEHQMSVASKLRKSIGRGELNIYLSPFQNTRQQSLKIVEALIHWRASHPCRLGQEYFQLLNYDPALMLDVAHWLINKADSPSFFENSLTENAIWVDLSAVPFRNIDDIYALIPERDATTHSHQLIIQVPTSFIDMVNHDTKSDKFSDFIQHLQSNRCALAIHLNKLDMQYLEQLPDSAITFAKLALTETDAGRANKALIQMMLKYCSMVGIQVFIDAPNSEINSRKITTEADSIEHQKN